MVGHRAPRLDAWLKALGGTRYAGDLFFPHLLYGKVLRSPYPHALLLEVDASRARRLPGIKAVVTGKELPSGACFGPYIADQPVIAQERVRYVGEPVAAVAGIDRDVAEEALQLIRVEYQELPAVFDSEEAMAAQAPLVHSNLEGYKRNPAVQIFPGTNICNHFKLRRGDVEKGFEQAGRIFEDRFTTQRAQHCALELHQAIAQVDQEGKVTLWASCQAPFAWRRVIADAFSLSYNKLRVIVPWLGGGFGSKNYPTVEPVAVMLAMAAKGLPVRIELAREEVFSATVVKLPCVIEIKTGVKDDGTLLARKMKIIWDTGAYGTAGPVVAVNAGYAAAGPYRIPHIWIDSYCVYTNNPVGGAFRGFGTESMAWAYESQMDMIARELGIDPVQLRLQNGLREGDESATGEKMTSVGLAETIRRTVQGLDNRDKREGDRYIRRGRGIASILKGSHIPSACSATVRMNEDGTAQIAVATVDMGQGARTVFAQITAQVLGLKLEDILVTDPDTDLSPYDWGTAASRATFFAGNAVRKAAEDVKQQILLLAEEKLEADARDLEMGQGRVFVKGSPDKCLELAELANYAHYLKGGPLLGKGVFLIPEATYLDPDTGQGAKPSAFWMYATQGAEVEVDLRTGQVQLLQLVGAHDLGKAINPLMCEQQIEGALVMGLSTSLSEELLVQRGRAINPSLADYKIPAAAEIPKLTPLLVEVPHPDGPFGAKGLGEPGLAPTAAAIANAIYDAAGVRIKELPITAEKVLSVLKARNRGKAF